MNKNDTTFVPFEFESPVEFFLVGVFGKKRVVVAKSKGARLDLIAYAQRNNNYRYAGSNSGYIFSVFFSKPMPLVAESNPIRSTGNGMDRRPSEWTFIWRGLGYTRHLRNIQKEFQLRLEDIVLAFENSSAVEIEWALSSIVDQCNRYTAYVKRKRSLMTFSSVIVLLTYIIGIMFFVSHQNLLR